MQDAARQSQGSSTKKRKQVSEAEKMALELSKLTSKNAQQSMLKFEDNKVYFLNTLRSPVCSSSCTWKDSKQWPFYCKDAEFRFEASLPDRFYLTRYSVSCSSCYKDQEAPCFHLYCSYCDEILTGSIAGPGGKITDHVITIRHVVKEAQVLRDYLARIAAVGEDEYVKVGDRRPGRRHRGNV
jgi:hypothetical protein